MGLRLAGAAAILWFSVGAAAAVGTDPFSRQVAEKTAALRDGAPAERVRAAEALGYLRAYAAEESLLRALAGDAEAPVRRNAALALGWCGGRRSLAALVARLDDEAWTVRQAAWVALTNLTGMEHPFDALAEPAERRRAAGVWRAWCGALPAEGLPAEVLTLLASQRHDEVTRGLRAAGALGAGAENVARLAAAVAPWRGVENESDAEAKWRVQAGLRALGRSGRPEALPVLAGFLANAQWARYAADALGELGGDGAAAALLAALPRYARPVEYNLFRESLHRAPGTHPSDVPTADSRDRILASAYAVAQALSRIPFDDPALVRELRGHAALIAAQLPLDIDGLVVYEEEPFQAVFRDLLDRAGAGARLLDGAFAALGQPRAAAAAAAPPAEAEDETPAARSPVLRGGDEAVRLEVDVSGWAELCLTAEEVDAYWSDRANWAEARLVDAEGRVTTLDTLTPVSAWQQHDALRVNRSAAFEDLRIGRQRFSRGLHTHARSEIRYRLDGRYRRFEAQVGVCASRAAGQGSVRFAVSPRPLRASDGEALLVSNEAFASNLLLCLCREPEEVPRVAALLGHTNRWVRINAARTLLYTGDARAVPALAARLAATPPEGAYGFFAPPPHLARAQGHDEFNDPTPRDREALVMALGGLRAAGCVPLLRAIMMDERSALGIRHRAALSLDRIGTPEAVAALREAERDHPYHSVRMAAREALWRRGAEPLPRDEAPAVAPPRVDPAAVPGRATRFVFIRGEPLPDNNPFQMDSWRQAYMTTDSGPTYRPGRNLAVLELGGGAAAARPLTAFRDGYVADCEVSYDGESVWFARRGQDSPWWHLWTVRADGSGLRQVTDGPYHDVQPVELPSGRIAFATTRLGTRDEYHGYLCTGLATAHPSGADIRVVGFNFGRDAEPAVADDGRLVFTRLELFYSRMKTEFNLLAAHPDGTRVQTLYGPERRAFWGEIHGGYGGWFAGGKEGGRHRHLRLTQPQAFGPGEFLLTTPAGPVLTRGRAGERLLRERFLGPGGNDPWVVATACRLDEATLLVAAARKNQKLVKEQFPKDAVALGLHTLDVATGELAPLYAEEGVACFEARPLHARPVPPVLAEGSEARGGGFTGLLYAQSVFLTQEPHLRGRGRLLRVVEALPQVTRHATHTTPGELAWKNHGGAFGRDLAVLPLAADGSFAAEVPADRFLHLQVLDSDRNVVGNQLIWMNVRPGEQKGCVGCHEPPQSAPAADRTAVEAYRRIVGAGEVPQALPAGEPFRYRAKIWFKGHVPDEREERQRTVQAGNWLARP